jgi:hypothetical protein
VFGAWNAVVAGVVGTVIVKSLDEIRGEVKGWRDDLAKSR